MSANAVVALTLGEQIEAERHAAWIASRDKAKAAIQSKKMQIEALEQAAKQIEDMGFGVSGAWACAELYVRATALRLGCEDPKQKPTQ